MSARTAVIYVLNGFFPNSGPTFAEIDCRPVIGDATEFAEWEALRKITGRQSAAAIQIDTGMNRLGFSIAEAEALLPRIHAGNHGITLVMSHLANAELLGDPMNGRQVVAFRDIASRFSGVAASLSIHRASSSARNSISTSCGRELALYGVNPTPEADTPMLPVINLKARIAQIRHIERGQTVGYGATWTARRPTRLAIVTAGYADGYLRAAGSVDNRRGAEAVVAGKRCPVAGRISMDLLAIDITDVPPHTVRRGSMATLIGDGITVDDLAHHAGTIGYEILTNLGKRFARVYVGEAD